MKKIEITADFFLNLKNKNKARICQYIALGCMEIKDINKIYEGSSNDAREKKNNN